MPAQPPSQRSSQASQPQRAVCPRKEAAKRNPSIILYGLPWAWAGWLGFGTNSPYANVTATADYTAKWIECGACHMHPRSTAHPAALDRSWVPRLTTREPEEDEARRRLNGAVFVPRRPGRARPQHLCDRPVE